MSGFLEHNDIVAMTNLIRLVVFLVIMLASTISWGADQLYVVFVIGDEEYRSEESMPMLAKMLKRDYGFRISIA